MIFVGFFQCPLSSEGFGCEAISLNFAARRTTVDPRPIPYRKCTSLLEHRMAKRALENRPAVQSPDNKEDKFIELMLVAADFVKSCGSVDQAKKALSDAGNFIQHAGSV